MNLELLKYPIGRYAAPNEWSEQLQRDLINDIEQFPKRLRAIVHSFSLVQLDTPYRPDGWTVRQVIHHCADSHMNSLMRFKLTLTENQPIIKPYFEDRWARLADSEMQIEPSLQMLSGIHQRWTVILHQLSEDDLERSFIHPETNSVITLRENIAIYAWHCNHHLAHISSLKLRRGW